MTTTEPRPSQSSTIRGTKRVCLQEACGRRFYDLGKDPMTCPYCEVIFVPEPTIVIEPKVYRKASSYKIVKPPPVVDQAEATDDNAVESDDAKDIEVESDADINDTGGATTLLDDDDEGEPAETSEIEESVLKSID